MATFTKFNAFVEHLAEGVHNFESHQLMVALSNDLPDAATDAILTDLTSQISYTNLSGATPRNLVKSTSSQSAGTYRLIINDLTLTATGAVGPFRYVIVYNDTPTSPAKPLIGWYDYGSSLTLQNGETLTLDFDPTNGILSLA